MAKRRGSQSTAPDSAQWRKGDGTSLNEEEAAEANRLWNVFSEAVPEEPVLSPIELAGLPLNSMLFARFAALYKLFELLEWDVNQVHPEDFIERLIRFSRAYLEKHLQPAIHGAIRMVFNSLYTQMPGVLAVMSGMEEAEVKSRFFATRADLRTDLNEIFQEALDGLPQRDGRGGDRRSTSQLSKEDRIKLAARKASLLPLWSYLIAKFEKAEYEHDSWEWVRKRTRFQELCITCSVTWSPTLDALAGDILKRRPYWDQTKSERMPESLSPAAFALRHAALEMGVQDKYEVLKKRLPRKGSAKSR